MTSEQKAKALAVMNAVESVSEDLGTLLGKMFDAGAEWRRKRDAEICRRVTELAELRAEALAQRNCDAEEKK